MEVLRLHYAETLRHWRRNLLARHDAVAALYDERFCRMFEFYLAGAELAFRRTGHMVWQMQVSASVGRSAAHAGLPVAARHYRGPAATTRFVPLIHSYPQAATLPSNRRIGYAAASMNEIHSPLLGLSQRQPPSNQQAEQALLGALLANNKAYERVSEFLSPEHFVDPVHGRIYQAIVRRVEAGQLADAVTLKAEFEHSGLLDEVGGTPYFAQLLMAMVGIINAGEYGRAVHDAWLRRQLIDIGEVVVNNAFGMEAELDGRQQIELAESELFRLATQGGNDGGFVTFERALTDAILGAERAFRRAGHVSGLSTGLRDLDKKTGGLHPSDLMILAGRPGMGKTALATKIAFGAAHALVREARSADPNALPKGSVAVFSLEMSAEQLATRLLAEEARVSGDRIRRGEIGQKDFDRFVQVSREIAGLPLHIDDTPAITLSALRTRCRRLKRTKGLSLVVIDYLQLMRPSVGTKPEIPRIRNQPDHPGPEGHCQGACGPRPGALPAFPRRRKP